MSKKTAGSGLSMCKLRRRRKEEEKAVLTIKQSQECLTPEGAVDPEGMESPKWLLGDRA